MENILVAKAAIQISKPVFDVFEAVVNPREMANYFIRRSSGRMEEGATLQWGFPELDGEFPVRVGTVDQDKKVVFYWDVKDKEHEVTITFTPYKDATVVKITETGEPVTDEGIAWLTGNTEGWASFLLCLKTWLEYGIQIRKGAYEWRFDKEAKV